MMKHIGSTVGPKVAVCVLFASIFATLPALASASTVWVSNAKSVKAPFNSCQNPGYNSIQTAIEGPSTTIRVCAGVYKEQLQIKRALTLTGESGAVIQLPASPADSTSACAASGEQDLVSVCGFSGATIKMSALTFEAYWPANTCSDELYGITVGGGANLSLTNSVVLGAGAQPLNGCQGGVGVQIGRHYTAQVATATLTADQISGYQKNGITVDNAGSQATIKQVTITGAGPAPLAQNGIQVSRGAVAKIAEDTISKDECAVASCGDGSYLELEEDAAGVLLYQEGAGTSVATSHIDENDLGVSHIAMVETTKAQVKITGDVLEGDRYAAVMLGQGFATVSKDEMRGGAVGILLLQYWAPASQEWPPAQEFGPKGNGSEDTIAGMTKHAVEGLSDNEANDQFGSFTITKSAISGNPGSVGESVFTNNPAKLKIITNSSDS
jgi:hypothetical protein